MLTPSASWTLTLVAATSAVAFALAGLVVTVLTPSVAPAATQALLLASLAGTCAAFGLVAARVRRLELENEGLVEEIAQELDRVKGQLDVYAEALVETDDGAARRVVVK